MFKFRKRPEGAREIAHETGSVRSRLIFLPVLALLVALVVELLEQILYGACTAEQAADTLMERGPAIIASHKN